MSTDQDICIAPDIDEGIYRSPIVPKEHGLLFKIFFRSSETCTEETRMESNIDQVLEERDCMCGMDITLQETRLIALQRRDGLWDVLKNKYEERRTKKINTAFFSDPILTERINTRIVKKRTDLSEESARKFLEAWNRGTPSPVAISEDQKTLMKHLKSMRKSAANRSAVD